jgi:hypothetical protein
MDAQEFRSLGYVTGAIGKNTLDVFPFHSSKRRYGRWGVFMRRVLIQIMVRIKDLLGVGRLTEVVIGAQFQRLHGRRDTSVTGQYDHRDGGIQLLDVLDQINSIETRHLQIEQDKVGTHASCETAGFFRSLCLMSLATAIVECPAKPIPEYRIVIDYKNNKMIAGRFLRTSHASYQGVRGLQ